VHLLLLAFHSFDPALQDLVTASLKARQEQRGDEDELSGVDVRQILAELLQLLRDEGILGISSDRDTLELITVQTHLIPFLTQQLAGAQLSPPSCPSSPLGTPIEVESDIKTTLNTILQSASTNKILCGVPHWKWKIILDFIRKNSSSSSSSSSRR
jgi:hypothetical protein